MNPLKQQQFNLWFGRIMRYLVIAILLVGVCKETGFWTMALFCVLILDNELKTVLYSKLTESVGWLASITMRVVQKLQEDSSEDNKED